MAAALVLLPPFACRQAAMAQVAAARQMGTVKAISGSNLTLTIAGGAQVTATVAEDAKILRLAPGSTDLKSAQPITLADVATGDRVLLTGKSAEDGSFLAARVILMKSSDIAERREQEQADWQRRGAGGIVEAVDTSAGTVTITSRSRKVTLKTSPKTQFLRYSGGSIKFEDAKAGTLAQLQPGDQLRVLGDKSEDGASIQAEEIISGTFLNLSGLISKIDAGAGQVTLKDLATKKIVTVQVTSDSVIRSLPEKDATMLAARARGAGAGGAKGADAAKSGEQHPHEAQRGAGQDAGQQAGSSLAQMLPTFPTEKLEDLKVGGAVMIVASQPDPDSPPVTAVTMLSGVEPLLTAAPQMNLSGWSVGDSGSGGGDVAQ